MDVSVARDPEGELKYLGYFMREFILGGGVAADGAADRKKLAAKVMALRTDIPADSGRKDSAPVPVTVAIVQLNVNFDAEMWNTGSVTKGMLTIPSVQLVFCSRPLSAERVTATGPTAPAAASWLLARASRRPRQARLSHSAGWRGAPGATPLGA